jgi:hypothetical protein
MQNQFMLKTTSTSYSQFLQPKNRQMHYITEPDLVVDINFFKKSISSHYQHLYKAKKWQNMLYRFAFFAFGLLFFVLGVLIFFKTTNYLFGFYFSNAALVKSSINLSCLLLAGSSFTTGYFIHPENEAILYLARKVEKELSTPIRQLHLELNEIFTNISAQRL